jgi:hypothetical protein
MSTNARRFRRARVIAAALGASLGAAPALAAGPAGQATQQLLAAQAAARTALHADLAAALAGATSAIASLETALAGTGDADAAGDALFTALQAFQVAVDAAMVKAADAPANAAKDALAALGGPLAGIYPTAFYPGDRTPTAAFEKAYTKELSKAYTKLQKRLGKTAAKFEAAGFGLTFRVAPPRPFPNRLWSENLVDFQTTIPAQIDVALAWSDVALAGDGRLRIAGGASTNEPVGLGDVTIFATSDGVNAQLDVAPEDGRFATDLAQTFPEGVWLVIVSQSSLTGTDVSIGIR